MTDVERRSACLFHHMGTKFLHFTSLSVKGMQVLDGDPPELPGEAQVLATIMGKGCITILDFRFSFLTWLFPFLVVKKKRSSCYKYCLLY